MVEAMHCSTCIFILKKLDSCPKFEGEANIIDILVQLIWVTCSVFPFILMAYFGVGLLKGRTPRLMLITGCLVVQVAVNELILKHSFKEPRPAGACSTTYGLPSGHSSFASFFMTWLILEGIHLSENASFKKEKLYIPFRNLGLIMCPLVPISRLFLNYHTVKQVCTGIIIGFVVAAACFYYLMSKGYQAWYEGELLMMKSSLEEKLGRENDLESDNILEDNPKMQKNTSLQPLQSTETSDLSL